ncbi:MAG: S1C family serine protease [Planctomycetota bacterium]
MRTATWIVSALCLPPAALSAQRQDFGAAYSFAERAPRTTVEQAVDRMLPSIVKVHGASGLATITSYATGIVVSERGHILTLDQVLVQKGRTRVVLYDGSVHQAQVLPEDPRLRVRLLRIDPSAVEGGLHPLWPPEGSAPLHRNGQFVVSLGNCFRLAEFSEKVSATFGVVVGTANTALRYRLSDVDYDGDLILTDACNNPGHYGGGLFDLQGNWIGLNTRLLESKETNTMLSAAIPSRDLLPYLREYVEGQQREEVVAETRPVWTGIVLFRQAGRQSPPAYVDRVQRGSPAAAIGLLPDDLIVRVDDYSVRSCKEFEDVLGRYAPGQKVTLTYKRGTRVLQAELELAEEKQ